MACHPSNPCAGVYGPSLDVKITDTCNGKCDFCIEKGGKKSIPVGVKTLIKSTLELPVENVLILGGEPLIYPDLVKYVSGISKTKRVYLTTNASLLTPELAEKLSTHITAINLSIHSYNMDANFAITGVLVNLQKIVESIKVFKSKGVKVRINCNLLKGGIDSPAKFDLMVTFARVLGVDGVRFAELQDYPEGFVSATKVTSKLGKIKDPFTEGCEKVIPDDSLEIKIRMTCGLVNPIRPISKDLSGRNPQTWVLYSDGTIDRGWRIEACHDTKVKKPLNIQKTLELYEESGGDLRDLIPSRGYPTPNCHSSRVQMVGCHGQFQEIRSCH